MSESQTDDKPANNTPKAVALLSGGLDSTLAVKMMLEQGVDVEAVAIKTPFCDFDCGKGCGHRVKEVAEELGIGLKTVYFGENYLRMLKNPKYGYGSGMNPCIDCRTMMYDAAKKHMETINADFIITGEVLSQRPMSQHKGAFNIIEKETDTKGLILRPLSAKHLPKTKAEDGGLIKREMLGMIKGRSRKGQLELAKKYEIENPPNAAGGCLLTDPAFSKRIRDLMNHSKDIPSIDDVDLLKVGRHFRLNENIKLIVGRNKEENEIIQSYKQVHDYIIEAEKFVGPVGLVKINDKDDVKMDDDLLQLACGIVLRYSDAPKNTIQNIKIRKGEKIDIIKSSPEKDETIVSLRI